MPCRVLGVGVREAAGPGLPRRALGVRVARAEMEPGEWHLDRPPVGAAAMEGAGSSSLDARTSGSREAEHPAGQCHWCLVWALLEAARTHVHSEQVG